MKASIFITALLFLSSSNLLFGQEKERFNRLHFDFHFGAFIIEELDIMGSATAGIGFNITPDNTIGAFVSSGSYNTCCNYHSFNGGGFSYRLSYRQVTAKVGLAKIFNASRGWDHYDILEYRDKTGYFWQMNLNYQIRRGLVLGGQLQLVRNLEFDLYTLDEINYEEYVFDRIYYEQYPVFTLTIGYSFPGNADWMKAHKNPIVYPFE